MEETIQKSCLPLPFQRLEENEEGDLVQLQDTIMVAMNAVNNTGAQEMVIGVKKVPIPETVQSEGEPYEL